MNSINISGRLTYDPELRTTQNGVTCANFTLAVRRPRAKDTTDFLRCVAWRHTAEYLTKYFRKGNFIAVTGIMTARDYTDKEGNKRTAYEVVVDNVDAPGNGGSAAAAEVKEEEYQQVTNDDKLPWE